MPEDEIISIVIGCVLFVFVAAVCTITVVATLRSRRSYLFAVHSHEIVVKVKTAGVFLYVDGTEEDAFAAQNISIATLRAQVDGEEFKARVTRTRIAKYTVAATHGGREVACIGITK